MRFMGFKKMLARKMLARVGGLYADDLLRFARLQRRRSVAAELAPAIGMLGLGLIVGAGFGLLLAPRSGRETRRAIGGRVHDLGDRALQKVRRGKGNGGVQAIAEDIEGVVR